MHTLFRAVGSTSNIAWVMLLQARRFGNLLLTQLASGGNGGAKDGRGSHTMRAMSGLRGDGIVPRRG